MIPRPAYSFLLGFVLCTSALFAQEKGEVKRIVVAEPLPEGAVARLGIPQPEEYETGSVGACTPEGGLIVAFVVKNEIRLRAWQSEKAPRPVLTLPKQEAIIVRLTMSENAHRLAVQDKTGTVAVWDVFTGEQRFHTKDGGPNVKAVTLDARGEYLAVSNEKGMLQVWNVATKKREVVQEQTAPITAIAFAGEGNSLAVGDVHGSIRVYADRGQKLVGELLWKPIPNKPTSADDLHLGKLQAPPLGLKYVIEFNEGVRHLRFSPDGKRLAAGGGTVVRMWELEKRQLLWEHNRHSFIAYDLIPRGRAPDPPHQAGSVADLRFTLDGKQLISHGGADGFRFCDATDANERFTQQFHRYHGGFPGLALEPTGKSYLVFLHGREFHEFSLPFGQPRATAATHRGHVLGLTFSPDGKQLASFGDLNLHLWDVAGRTHISTISLPGGHSPGAAFSPDGKFLKSGHVYHGTFKVWKCTEKGLVPWLEGQPLSAKTAVFLGDQPATLLQLRDNGPMETLQLADGERKRIDPRSTDTPMSLAAAPDGKSYVLGFSAWKKPVHLDLKTSKPIHELEGPAMSDTVAFSPDGRLIAATGSYGDQRSPVHLWDAKTGHRYLDLRGHTSTVRSLAFSSDGRVLASSSADHSVCLWELATGKLLRTIKANHRQIQVITFSPTEPLLASSGVGGAIYLWDVRKELTAARPLPKELGRGLAPGADTGMWARRIPMKTRPGGLTFSPDGKTLAVGGGEGHIHLIDPATGEERSTFGKHASRIQALAFTPDGKTLATSSYYYERDDAVRVWDVATGKQLFAHDQRRTMADTVAFSPDGKTLYNLNNDGFQAWDWQQKQARTKTKVEGSWAYDLALSPDGRWLLLPGRGAELIVWDCEKEQEHQRVKGEVKDDRAYLYAVAFSSDGRLAASAGSGGFLQLWDAKTWKPLRAIKTTGDRGLNTIAFSPRGDRIASGGEPNTNGGDLVRIWDVGTGHQLLTVKGHAHHIAWSPDGRWLATLGQDSQERNNQAIYLWDIDFLIGRAP